MKEVKIKQERKERRLKRVRKKIFQISDRPRLSVFASNKYFYAQIIDDTKGETLVSANEKEIDSELIGDEKKEKLNKSQKAEKLGKIIARKAKEKKISKVVLDKGASRYHGKLKLFAQAARKEGLVF
ncbi:50S ribosomal protein L18 [Candidatus Parcubacteria bacterium]|nr:MAG: 50S ribosomal protein L18 [Candidatus Parcubacteria bacterium]